MLATGTVQAPQAEGTYQVRISNLFADVIKEGETGDIFWAIEHASGVITVPSFEIVGAQANP